MSSRLQDSFNLRISEGNDEIEHSRFGDFNVSIHAPVRERPGSCAGKIRWPSFQFTLPWGSDAVTPKRIQWYNFSIDNLEWPLCPNCARIAGIFCRLPEKWNTPIRFTCL